MYAAKRIPKIISPVDYKNIDRKVPKLAHKIIYKYLIRPKKIYDKKHIPIRYIGNIVDIYAESDKVILFPLFKQKN